MDRKLNTDGTLERLFLKFHSFVKDSIENIPINVVKCMTHQSLFITKPAFGLYNTIIRSGFK